jgi:hypothetical protein
MTATRQKHVSLRLFRAGRNIIGPKSIANEQQIGGVFRSFLFLSAAQNRQSRRNTLHLQGLRQWRSKDSLLAAIYMHLLCGIRRGGGWPRRATARGMGTSNGLTVWRRQRAEMKKPGRRRLVKNIDERARGLLTNKIQTHIVVCLGSRQRLGLGCARRLSPARVTCPKGTQDYLKSARIELDWPLRLVNISPLVRCIGPGD